LPAALVTLVLVGAGCTVTSNTNTATTTTTPTTTDDAVVADTTATGTAATLWGSGVTQGAIPSTALAGTINSVPVTIAHVQVDFDGEEYDWTFSDTDNTSTCSFKTGDSEVNLRTKDMLSGTLTKTLDQDVEFDDYHSYYVYPQENGSPMSVNTDWDATVVVTGITRGLEEGTFGQSVGSVTGFADISFGDGKTAISGAFEAELCEDAVE